jgi:hypothetical protein
VQLLRSRESIIGSGAGPTPRKTHIPCHAGAGAEAYTSSSSSSSSAAGGDREAAQGDTLGKSTGTGPGGEEAFVTILLTPGVSSSHMHPPSLSPGGAGVGAGGAGGGVLYFEEQEREERLIYLRQAFCGLFWAKHGVEMQNLARVICAILGVGAEEQATITDCIARLNPAIVATSTLETISYKFLSLFA